MQILWPLCRLTVRNCWDGSGVGVRGEPSSQCFNKFSSLFWCILKFENPWFNMQKKNKINQKHKTINNNNKQNPVVYYSGDYCWFILMSAFIGSSSSAKPHSKKSEYILKFNQDVKRFVWWLNRKIVNIHPGEKKVLENR